MSEDDLTRFELERMRKQREDGLARAEALYDMGADKAAEKVLDATLGQVTKSRAYRVLMAQIAASARIMRERGLIPDERARPSVDGI